MNVNMTHGEASLLYMCSSTRRSYAAALLSEGKAAWQKAIKMSTAITLLLFLPRTCAFGLVRWIADYISRSSSVPPGCAHLTP